MKLDGQPFPPQEVVTVVLPRGTGSITIKVSGFPLGVQQDFLGLWPRPRPPGKKIHKVGGAEETAYDYDDAAFNKELNLWAYHKNIYTVYRAMLADSRVSFDTHPKDAASMVVLGQEMLVAGLSEGDIARLLRGINDASHIDNKDIEASKETF